MSRIRRAPAPVVCPACGFLAGEAPHFCSACGYDFWRSAARDAAAHRPAPLTVPVQQPGNRAFIFAGVTGLLLAAAATALAFVGSGPADRTAAAYALPAPGREDRLIERFYWQVRSPSASFTMRADGTYRLSGSDDTTIALEAIVRFDDADWTADATVTVEGEDHRATAALVDGRYYETSGDRVVSRGATYRDREAASPFARISTVGEVAYVGAEVVAGEALHHLRVEEWLGGRASDLFHAGLGLVTDRQSSLDLWVTDDGTPIRASSTITLETLDDERQRRTYTGEMTMHFAGWGETEDLEPPS